MITLPESVMVRCALMARVPASHSVAAVALCELVHEVTTSSTQAPREVSQPVNSADQAIPDACITKP